MAMNVIPGAWSSVLARIVLRDYQPRLAQLGIDIDALDDERIVDLYRDLFGTKRPQDAPTSQKVGSAPAGKVA